MCDTKERGRKRSREACRGGSCDPSIPCEWWKLLPADIQVLSDGPVTVYPLSDQCVDKAKVEESEQKATEFSKKVRHYSLGHFPPFCWPPQSGKFLLAQSCQTGYWFFMLWSMPGCDATWSLSALQQSMAVLMYTCMRTAPRPELHYVQALSMRVCTSAWVFEGRSQHLNAAVSVKDQTRLFFFF